MLTLAYRTKGIGPADLYTRVNGLLYLPEVYRPKMVVGPHTILLEFPGSTSNVSYVDPNDPTLTYIAQRYRPFSLFYVKDLTIGECEISDFVPTRCDDFATYINWYFTLIPSLRGDPSKFSNATYGVSYDGPVPYQGSLISSDIVVDTVCYGNRSKCFTTSVKDVPLFSLHDELSHLWQYAKERIGVFESNYLSVALSESGDLPSSTSNVDSVSVTTPAVPKPIADVHVKRVPKIVYNDDAFVCVNVAAIEPLQIRQEVDCGCQRVFITPYLKADLIPISCPQGMFFDPVVGDCVPGPSLTPDLPPGYTVNTPRARSVAGLRYGMTTWSSTTVGGSTSLAGSKDCTDVALIGESNSDFRCESYSASITGVKVSNGIINPARNSSCTRPTGGTGVVRLSNETRVNIQFYNLVTDRICHDRSAALGYTLINPCYPEFSEIVTGGYCISLLERDSLSPTGYRIVSSFSGLSIPPVFANDRPPAGNCFLTTNSIEARILRVRSGVGTSTFSVRITAPPLCESYTPKSLLDNLALQLQKYMTLLGKEFQLGPFTFKSTKGAQCRCP